MDELVTERKMGRADIGRIFARHDRALVVPVFEEWLIVHPDGIEALRYAISTASYHVQRTAHMQEDKKKIEVCVELLTLIREAERR